MNLDEQGAGREFFEASKRLHSQIQERKSWQPKNVASNCKVKAEYLRYL